MAKKDDRIKERIPLPRPGTRFKDKKKEQSRLAARRWAKERFKEDS